MALWEQQLIRGEKKKWAFGVGYVQDLRPLVLTAYKDGEPIAVQFVEKNGDYIECHPPMYDKKHSKRYLAKYMWFNLIKFAIESDINFVDLGGGKRGTWPELIRSRDQHPNTTYKWTYIPKHVKDNPGLQPNYEVIDQQLVTVL